MKEYRCPECRRLLLIGEFAGWAETVCKSCGKRRRFDEPKAAQSGPMSERPGAAQCWKALGHAAKRDIPS